MTLPTTKASHIATVLVVWWVLLAIGTAGIEMYVRHVHHYLLPTWKLRRSNFFEEDRLKVWNRRLYEKQRSYFLGWPIPLAFFDADTPAPRYLFKPNLRMAVHGIHLVPARPGERVYWSSNAWGFRGAEIQVKKPQGVIRIVCLGASTTEGSQGDQETYPYYLERQLRRIFPRHAIEVINGGHHGQGVDDLLEILRRRVFPLHPDVVIWYEGANDAYPPEFAKGLRCELGWPSGDCWLASYPVWHRWLYAHSAVFVVLSDALGWNGHGLPPMPHEFDDLAPKSSVDHYGEVLREMTRETTQRKIAFVLSSFVTLTGPTVDSHDPRFKPWYPLTPAELGRMYRYVNRTSAEVAREFHVPYVDAAARFPKDRRFFPFDIFHFSPEGNQLLAGLFADVLTERVIPPLVNALPSARPH